MSETTLSPLSALVVEDHPDAAESLAELLTLCGCDVRVTACARDALHWADAEMPELILLDIGLPGMNGWEIARWLREHGGGKRPFIVAVTGYGSDADRRRSVDAGIDMHFVKPVNPTTLIALLAKLRGVHSTLRLSSEEVSATHFSQILVGAS